VKEKPTVGSIFFGAFPSRRICKVTKDVGVHFFIHRFAFRNELSLDNALARKKRNFPLPLSIGNFLRRGGSDDLHSEDAVSSVDRIGSTIFHPL
jgi:hypothetical protein